MDEAAVLAEIQRLEGAIKDHSAPQRAYSHSYAYQAPRRGFSYGAPPARGRGRGFATTSSRGWAPPTAATRGRGSMKLVLNRPSPAPAKARASVEAAKAVHAGAVRLEASIPTAPVQPPAATITATTKPPAPPGSKEVQVGGVIFISDASGRKLVRKSGVTPSAPVSSDGCGENLPDSTPAQASGGPGPPAPTSEAAAINGPATTPRRVSVEGNAYIRTKSGNLISAEALKRHRAQKAAKREMAVKKARLMATTDALRGRYSSAGGGKRGRGRARTNTAVRPPVIKQDKQCRFFAKTGTCRKGLTCPYQHDPRHVAICRHWLKGRCPLSSAQCQLSHAPTPHNMTHCAHFPRCTRPGCPYAHVTVSPTAPVCNDFSELGWCGKGLDCAEQHVRECKEFKEKGTCSKQMCRLPHIIARGKRGDLGDNNEANEERMEKGNLEVADEDDDHGGVFFPQDLPIPAPNLTKIKSRLALSKDDLQANDDFVMFESSDEEGDGRSEDGHEEEVEEEEDSLSVDSEELDALDIDQAGPPSQPEDRAVDEEAGIDSSDEEDDSMLEAELLGERRTS